MNGFPSVQYMTVCAFLISSWQKPTKQNAGLGLPGRSSHRHDPVAVAPASGRPGMIGRRIPFPAESLGRTLDFGRWAGGIAKIQKSALDLF